MFRVNLLIDTLPRRRAAPAARDRRLRRCMALPCVLLVLVLLAACGSSNDTPDDRSFANNPAKQNDQPTATAAATATMTPTPPPTPAPSPAALLHPRGAASRFYVAVGGQLLVITERGTARQIDLPQKSELLGFDWSPDGGHVAVAVGSPGKKQRETAVSLLVMDKDGKTVRNLPDVLTLPARDATPSSGAATAVRVMVDWGLVENQLAVATDTGKLVAVPASGKPRALAIDLKGQVVREMRISPQGDTAALLLVDDARRGTVATVSLTSDKPQSPKPLAGYGVDTRRSATAFSWVPDGRRLLYTQTDVSLGGHAGGELYVLDTRTKERRLIDTGGRAGPSAGVFAFAPSPDAKSVAYVIGIDEGTTWVANSLWIRSLKDQAQIAVPIGNADNIDGVWWTSGGLVWAVRSDDTRPGGSYQTIFFQQSPDGKVRELLRISVKRGVAATPAASPVASPIATPGASPSATPTPAKRG